MNNSVFRILCRNELWLYFFISVSKIILKNTADNSYSVLPCIMSMNSSPRQRFKKKKSKENFGKHIPDRWLNYDPVGRALEGTPFVPFKTPLDKSFFIGKRSLSADEHFDVERFINLARRVGKTIGMVVDLTNTNRYYNKTDWEEYGIKYIKIDCPGHEVNRREDIVQNFLCTVDEFVNESINANKLIGVHCTHGLNRTGYLICRYLIDRMGWTATRAISEFEYSRGHPIERAHYKKSLYEAEKRKLKKASSLYKNDIG
ncbi:tyrosine-protein phosphatase family protein [Dictyocaulus viviparus]|uniref:Tyrosine-protein phosphatase family protein n=1 Tax=Dictyocaulus viviparus TaxID=29172 RepID=A0A0D8XFR3_DICVI|nr:tyrosine-protein phosphatase family protein [Dictyocaulus viviparus]